MSVDVEAIRDLYRSSSLGSPDKAIGFVLWRVMHRYQRAAERELAPHGLTHLQFTTLAVVGWMCCSGKPVSQAELARQADIHPMQVSLMLKALEGKDMIFRAPSPDDTRARLVAITPSGLQALRVTFPIVIDLQRRMFGAEGAPGGQLLTILRQIERSGEHSPGKSD